MLVVSIGIKVFKFQPTRPLRGATESVPALATSDFLISTHAPLAGRDRGKGCTLLDSENFNPRAPCGARLQLKPQLFDFLDFNPRAPCGARRFSNDGFTIKICISTHAPLAGRDRRDLIFCIIPFAFQPTRPLRGATVQYNKYVVTDTDFNPRAPCGARPCYFLLTEGIPYFNPRAPCGARQQKSTNHYAHFCDNRQISDAFAQNAACQGILLLFDAGKPCGFWVRTAQVISAHLCFAL